MKTKQQEVEELVKKTLNKTSFTESRKVFNGFLYFFKKEITQDHYFYLESDIDKKELFCLKHNADNYNPSITETGKFSDSFKIPMDNENICKIEIGVHTSKILSDTLATIAEDIYDSKIETKKNILLKIDFTINQLNEIRNELNQML